MRRVNYFFESYNRYMETVQSPAEHRVVLHNVSWKTYEELLAGRGERRIPRFAYDQGELEIMSPSTEHEHISHVIGLLVEVFAGEVGVNVYGVGSTTFQREDLERGFEPDACFYIQNEELVRGKPRIDLNVDPPPDLVIEVDITHPSLDKFPIYARVGVPEIWRYDGDGFAIFELGEAEYDRAARSVALPPLTSGDLSGFIKDSTSLGSADWMRKVREWARTHDGG